MMDFENFVQKLSTQSINNEYSYSSDDSNFESMPDSKSVVSDDEYIPHTRGVSPGKRMQTFPDNHRGKIRKISTTSSTTDNGRIERLPTRRPDPTVRNRNALMARENRKKKKQHVELLQNELEQSRREVKGLKKIMRERDRSVAKLRHETMYLRSIIANKTDIMTMLKTIKGNKMPLTSSTLSFVTEDEDQCQRRLNGSEASRSPATTSTASICEEEKENDFDLGFSNSTISDELALGNWNNLFNDDANSMVATYIPELPDANADLLSNVKNEHNYYLNNNNDEIKRKERQDDISPGICLHLSGGRVSLEFCAACHSSSENAWMEEM